MVAVCYRDEFATNFNSRIGTSTSRFYSVVVDDARNINFDGDTRLRRRFVEHNGGRRARWSVLSAKAKVEVFLPQNPKHQR